MTDTCLIEFTSNYIQLKKKRNQRMYSPTYNTKKKKPDDDNNSLLFI